jgi:hypothetical protein
MKCSDEARDAEHVGIHSISKVSVRVLALAFGGTFESAG